MLLFNLLFFLFWSILTFRYVFFFICLSKYNGFWFSTDIKNIWFSFFFKTFKKKNQQNQTKYPGFVIHFTFYLCWWMENILPVGIFSSTVSRINTLYWVTSDPWCVRSHRHRSLMTDWRQNEVSDLKVSLECNPYLDYLDRNFSYLVFSVKEKPETLKERDTWVFWKAWSSNKWKTSLLAEQHHWGLEKDEG